MAAKRKRKAAKAKRANGRPTLYRKEYDARAHRLCLLGLTDELLAESFGVAKSTLELWQVKHVGFSDAIRRGRVEADARVGEKLYERALGYSHPEDKIFQFEGAAVIVPTTKHYPPDTAAASLWLRNRQPKLWRDKIEHELAAKDGNLVIVGVQPGA